MSSKFSLKQFAVAAAVVGSFGLFQNCAKFSSAISGAGGTTETLSTTLPFGHPDVVISNAGIAASGAIVLGDRDYLESVFRDVFTSSASNASTIGYLEAVMSQEFAPTQGALGHSCDPYEDGTLERCANQLNNLDTPMASNSSSIREAARVQVCQRLLGNDTMLGLVVAKVQSMATSGGAAMPNTPTSPSITAAIQLFYPAADSALSSLPSLVNLDAQMASQGETVNDRWRMIFLTLCESPEWEVL